jgi:hypothetical protein
MSCPKIADERWRKIWMQFKQYVRTKNSHGKNELLNAMNDFEINEFTKEEDAESKKGEVW